MAVEADDVKNSLRPLFLGLSITLTYIICNVPLSAAMSRYLHDESCPTPKEKIILQALLTSNTVVDPILYALFDLVIVCRERMAKHATVAMEKLEPLVDQLSTKL